MKYITFDAGSTIPGILIFSKLTHAEAAHMVGKRVIGAGFVTIPNARAFTGGISTSLLVGPSELDAKAIEFELEQTAREYPPPPAPLAAAILCGDEQANTVEALAPEEQAALFGERAPSRCTVCGALVACNGAAVPVCRACSSLRSEYAHRAHIA